MSRLVLVTGGASSGKSQFAVELAMRCGEKITFVATCLSNGDDEMREKIEIHRKQRPSHWTTVENRLDLARVIQELPCQGALIDSLSLFVSGSMMDGKKDDAWRSQIHEFCDQALSVAFPVIVVTDEVGSGLIPENKLGRKFREALGFANQQVAAKANEVYLMVSGLPVKLKG